MASGRTGWVRSAGWALAAVALLAALGLGALALWGPDAAAARGTAVLRQAGYPAAAVRVDRLGPTAAAGTIVLAEGQGVERFTVSYTPWSLLAGRVGRVTVTGLRLRLAVGPDGLSLAGREAPAGQGGGWPDRLPFRALALA